MIFVPMLVLVLGSVSGFLDSANISHDQKGRVAPHFDPLDPKLFLGTIDIT